MKKEAQQPFTMDTHVHVDEHVDYHLLPQVLRAKKLDGAGLVTHNNFSFATKVCKMLHEKDRKKVYLNGVEIDTSQGHLVAFGIDREIPPYRSPEETIELVHELGGIAIIPHPFMAHNSFGKKARMLKADALEFLNGFAKIFLNTPNFMAQTAFRYNDFAELGGSDAHYVFAVGSCYSQMDVESPLTEDTILEAIRKQKTKAIKSPLDKNDIINFVRIIFGKKEEGRHLVKFLE